MPETLATETFVSHLECGLPGDRYEADKIHGLSSWHLLSDNKRVRGETL